MRNQFKLGADASVAAGPVGRDAQAATDLQLRAQILSYSRARGLFAGVTINGSTIRQDRDANERFYGKRLETSADRLRRRRRSVRRRCRLARHLEAFRGIAVGGRQPAVAGSARGVKHSLTRSAPPAATPPGIPATIRQLTPMRRTR